MHEQSEQSRQQRLRRSAAFKSCGKQNQGRSKMRSLRRYPSSGNSRPKCFKVWAEQAALFRLRRKACVLVRVQAGLHQHLSRRRVDTFALLEIDCFGALFFLNRSLILRPKNQKRWIWAPQPLGHFRGSRVSPNPKPSARRTDAQVLGTSGRYIGPGVEVDALLHIRRCRLSSQTAKPPREETAPCTSPARLGPRPQTFAVSLYGRLPRTP